MDLTKAIAELQEELARIDEALYVLSRLASGTKRRGRPPKWLAESKPAESPRKATRRGKKQVAAV